MLKMLRKPRGQVVSAEYAVMIVAVVLAVTSMLVYVRRAVQGRLYDANWRTMAIAANAYGNRLAMEYEPYYALSATNTDQKVDDDSHILPGGHFARIINYERQMTSSSEQLQPGAAE